VKSQILKGLGFRVDRNWLENAPDQGECARRLGMSRQSYAQERVTASHSSEGKKSRKKRKSKENQKIQIQKGKEKKKEKNLEWKLRGESSAITLVGEEIWASAPKGAVRF
jgi:hypothetical protein